MEDKIRTMQIQEFLRSLANELSVDATWDDVLLSVHRHCSSESDFNSVNINEFSNDIGVASGVPRWKESTAH